jgi:hypothetical protein
MLVMVGWFYWPQKNTKSTKHFLQGDHGEHGDYFFKKPS